VRRDAERGIGEEQRVAVGRGARDRLGADVAARARAVLDDHRLAELGLELRLQDAGDEVDQAAGRIRHDNGDRPRGKALRGGAERGERKQQDKSNSEHGFWTLRRYDSRETGQIAGEKSK